MASPLWKACSAGDLQIVIELLKEASSIDIEIKDHTGSTPLIEAIRNGHIEVVRALLDKGADPMNGSSHARPEQYTTDHAILDVLRVAQSKVSTGLPSHEHEYTSEVNSDSEKRYYMAPPGAYAYYPSIHPSAQPLPEGAVAYYAQPPPHAAGEQVANGGIPNLPPPEVARLIPCRYFPACRYGSSCLFAHPQGPYFQGPLPPPAPYTSSYEHAQPYTPYYAVPPPSFQSPSDAVHHIPILPAPHHNALIHVRSPSEILPPQGHFSPSAVPPPGPYGVVSPVSPSYTQPIQSHVPVPIPIQHQAPLPPPAPLSPQPVYTPSSPPPPFSVRHDANVQYPAKLTNGGPKAPPPVQNDNYVPSPVYREGMGHHRRGSFRRGSFTSRKPPCLFFPAGRCKNGDDCRFPHIIPEGVNVNHHQPHYNGRGGMRNRPHVNGNGDGILEEKLSNMAIRDGFEGSSRSQSTDPGSRPRYPNGYRGGHMNGTREKRAVPKQRVPNADEFPVLVASATPPSRSLNGSLSGSNGYAAPTAAQVLQAPPPTRKDSKESSSRAASPDPRAAVPTKEIKNGAPNGDVSDISYENISTKPPISFATIATAVPDLVKEVSVSA